MNRGGRAYGQIPKWHMNVVGGNERMVLIDVRYQVMWRRPLVVEATGMRLFAPALPPGLSWHTVPAMLSVQNAFPCVFA